MSDDSGTRTEHAEQDSSDDDEDDSDEESDDINSDISPDNSVLKTKGKNKKNV